MEFRSDLIEAILLKRLNQFLADVALNPFDKRVICCLNEGNLQGCDVLGSRIWFSQHATGQSVWELVETSGGHLAAVNQSLSPALVIEGIQNGVIKELQGYEVCDVPDNLGGLEHVDLLLKSSSQAECCLKIQDMTLADEIGRGFFPDAVNAEAAKHLTTLIRKRNEGKRAVLFVCVKHTGIKHPFIAKHIDTQYCALVQDALQAGVEIVAYKAAISLMQVVLVQPIVLKLPGHSL